MDVKNIEDPLQFKDILDKVHGKHRGGYMRGYGKGITQRELQKKSLHGVGISVYAKLQEELDQKNRELAEANAKLVGFL